MKIKIQIKTIAAKHVAQLPHIHNWDGTYPWQSKNILGRSATDGFILVQDKKSGELERVSPTAYVDSMFAVVGGKLPNGEYAPPPHTEYSRKAAAMYELIPQLFLE